MIDTDKYEGASTWGKWSVGHEGQHDLPEGDIPINVNGGLNAIAYSQADAQLIADAPLLLAEVKQLREQGRKLVEAAERVRSDISDQDTGWYYQLGNHIEKMNRLLSE